MRLGVKLPYADPNATTEGLKTFISAVDSVGFDSIWLGDHFVLPATVDRSNYPYLWRFTDDQLARPDMQNFFPVKHFLEAMVSCGFIAGVTHRMSIGIGVLVVPMRNPVQLAAEIATLDLLSAGKTIVAVGTGWMREEFVALGREAAYEARGRYLDEAIAAMRALWGDQPAEYAGELISFGRVYCQPTPLQAGGPPIWVGGDSKRALRRTVEIGDGWQPVELPASEFGARSKVLDGMLEAAGRDPATVARSVSTRLPLTTAADGRAAEMIAAYRDAGCTDLILYSSRRYSIGQNTDRAAQFMEIASEVLDRPAART